MSETPCEGGRAILSPGTWPVFDAHFHSIDPRFPLIPGQGYLPEPFTARDYLERTSTLNVTGGAIVSGSFQEVKATGFGRVRLDVATALREISAVDPGALVFGTDLPGTRARRSFRHVDLDLIFENLGEQTARRVLYSNAVELYSDEKEKDKGRG